MELNRCPNCSGRLELSSTHSRLMCPFCGSEFAVEKKTVRSIRHEKVPYLFFEYSVGLPGVKLGEQYGNNIGIFNSHYDMQGTVAALVCFLSFEIDGSRPKMSLTS